MCTVSYIPRKGNGYILTSNRDESIQRPEALPIRQYSIDGKLVYFPKDPKAGGTWISTNGHSRTVCLLNGGFVPHDMSEARNYRKSRGQVVLDVFRFDDAESFADNYDFSDIEPFTLILVETTGDRKLTELRWDGNDLHRTSLEENNMYIWSSVTLYPEEVRESREALFNDWISEHPDPTQDEMMLFHRWGSQGNEAYDLVMRQGIKQTVSICSISVETGTTEMRYHDLISNEYSKHLIYQ